jgi:hypothetical protein
MHIEARNAPWRSTLLRLVATALLVTLAACSRLSDTKKPIPDKNAPRDRLQPAVPGGRWDTQAQVDLDV